MSRQKVVRNVQKNFVQNDNSEFCATSTPMTLLETFQAKSIRKLSQFRIKDSKKLIKTS